MKRKILLAALLSTLAISGLAIGGDSGSLASDCCDPSYCPPGCEPCPIPCETACAADAGAIGACALSQ